MARAASAVSVTTSATAIIAASTIRASAIVYNNGASTVFLGPSTVTTVNGLPLGAGLSFEDSLAPGQALYGIVASGTCDVRVLEG